MRSMLFLVIILLVMAAMPFSALASEVEETEVRVTTEETTENNNTTPQPSKRISDVLNNQGGMKEIKPLDLDAMGDKMVDLGDKSFSFLQKGSLTLLVWGIGLSVVILFFGIIFGKAVVMAGFVGIVISLIGFVFIQFVPETASSLINGVENFFGK